MPRFAQLSAIVCILALSVLCSRPALAERRTALVIGNAAYQDAPLKNTVNDAADMAEALKNLGFEVILRQNADLRQMNEAIDLFWTGLKSGGVGLFYYSGHGIQAGGENFLVPVDAKISTEKDVPYACVNAGKILGRMEDAGNGLNIVILDACRNNPFARSFRSESRGLAIMDAPTGSLLAYSTAPGDVAADGEGRNGLYTSYLLKYLRTPGLKIEDVFKRVRVGVSEDSGKMGRKQVPWETSSLMGDFYFNGRGTAPAGSMPVPSQASLTPSARPLHAQTGPVTATAPAPNPDEAKLLDLMRGAWSAKHDVERNQAKGLAKPLAAKGSIYGQYALGWLSEDDGERDKAIKKAAQQGIPLAMVHYAEVLESNPVGPDDLSEARDWLNKALSLGEVAAKPLLGRMLIKGEGGPADRAAGERLLAEAARERIGYNLLVGTIYWGLADKGIPKDEASKRGLGYVNRGADLGDTHAMMQMGFSYEFGEHVAKNREDMIWWFTRAAEKGDTYGMVTLGLTYLNTEDGAQPDEISAAKWFRKASEAGDLSGTIFLAKALIGGRGVPKDVKRGLDMLMNLANQGQGFAQCELAKLYEEGLDVPKNKPEAYFWFTVAANAGDIEGKVWSKSLAKELSAGERAKAEARAAKWKPVKKKTE